MLYHHGLPRRSDLDLLTAAGRDWLTELSLPAAAREQITIALRMIDALDARDRRRSISELRAYARRQPGCRALIEPIYGIGELTSVAILAELGDCRRFSSSRDAVRYGGLDITVHALRPPPRARAPLPPRTTRRCAGRSMRPPNARDSPSQPRPTPTTSKPPQRLGAQPRLPRARAQAAQTQLPVRHER